MLKKYFAALLVLIFSASALAQEQKAERSKNFDPAIEKASAQKKTKKSIKKREEGMNQDYRGYQKNEEGTQPGVLPPGKDKNQNDEKDKL